MSLDILNVLLWWSTIFVLGLLFLPLTAKLFKSFFDKGYLFSKSIAIAVSAYSVWLLNSLRLAPFARIAIILVLAGWGIFSWYRMRGKWRNAKEWLISCLRFIIIEEGLFLVILLFWSYIRGLQPDIYGLEKFMDYGFVNTILRSKWMPPIDMWFAGKSINYYYFGQFVCAFLIKLIGIDSSVAYNLMLATLAAFTFGLTFSLVGNLFYVIKKDQFKKALAAGLISAALLTFGGNLHGFIYGQAEPFIREIMHQPAPAIEYYYPQSTRYIGYNPPTDDKTIHEFPLYSFVVSDLHGHVSDIPFVLTFLALLLGFVSGQSKSRRQRIGEISLAALLLAVMYMTNTWDYPIYITVGIAMLVYHQIRAARAEPIAETKLSSSYFYGFLALLAAIILLSQLLLLPFNLSFKNITGGVAFVHAHTPLYQLLVLWGYQLFFAASFLVFIFQSAKSIKKTNKKGWFNTLLDKIRSLPTADMFCLILSLCAAGLVLMPEIVYVIDIYSAGYHRANTMFKLTYQAFILFDIVIGYIAVRLFSEAKWLWSKLALGLLFTAICAMPMIYPFMAIPGYYRNIAPSNYKGLYGLDFLKIAYPGDYKAVNWLNANISGQPVILEAYGDSYTIYGRISAMTGLPTIQGWHVHEWLWRGSSEEPTAREKEVAVVYESADMEKTLQILTKYNVQYIIVGNLEREKFKQLNEAKLLSLGKVIFDEDGTKIIAVDLK